MRNEVPAILKIRQSISNNQHIPAMKIEHSKIIPIETYAFTMDFRALHKSKDQLF